MREKINISQLTSKEMKETLAGVDLKEICVTPNCFCACCYADTGGSTLEANCSANHINGWHSDCAPSGGGD